MPRNKGRGWNPETAWDFKTPRHQAPPNLRGKALGLYYRDRYQKTKRDENTPKRPKEITITFGIPASVENRVSKNLQNLFKEATSLNIPPAPIGISLQTFEKTQDHNNLSNLDIQMEEKMFNLDPTDGENSSLNMSIESIDESYIFKKPDSNTVIKKEYPKSDAIPVIKQESESSSIEDSIPLIKQEASNCPQSGSIPVIKKEDPISPKEDSKTDTKQETPSSPEPSSSSAPDFIPINDESLGDYGSEEHLLSLRGGGDYKYSYEDIITGSFDEKLDWSLSKGIGINLATEEIKRRSVEIYKEYKNMTEKVAYKRMLSFRKTLPTYKKSQELLNVIKNNQIVVISGETGCGKSTQVPQIILDDAICNNRGANIHILVTQPRRIAASSLASRVAAERAEMLGNSVGYVVRLEKVDPRPRGSITYCTTGVLLSDLEINQGLTNYSHVILDEVHERDCHIDLSMCMLKKVLNKRKDLKLILMSATLDADRLSEYFEGCPLMHIEGLAYPVKDIYLEDILLSTQFELPPEDNRRNQPKGRRGFHKFAKKHSESMQKEIQYRAEIGPWLERTVKERPELRQVHHTLIDPRIEMLNCELILELLIHICKGPPGAVLVFLPGIGDITKLMNLMGKSQMFGNCEVYPLHSKLASLEQHKIFERPPPNIRKIIIATNIAETSITIDDIIYVVDCARLKMSGLNVEENVSTLKIEWASQTNLHQRRGRAGRCQPGVCYHLATSYRASTLPERLLPELQRSDLLEPVLSIKRLRLGKAAEAMAMMPSPPAESTVKWAVQHLQQCGALNEKETLTPLGWHLARLPVHPSAGKLLLLGSLFGCLDRAASVAAVWGFKDPFQLVIGKEAEVDEAKRSLAQGEPSDHVAVSEAIIQWENCPVYHRQNFAYRNYLSNNTLQLLSEMKHQFGDSLKHMGFLPSGNVKEKWANRNAANISLFKAVVAASLYPKVASVRWVRKGRKNGKQSRILAYLPGEHRKVTVHPSSVMTAGHSPGAEHVKLCNDSKANWLVYWLKQRSSDLFLIDVTLVYTLPVLFFGELTVIAAEDNIDKDMCLMSISSVQVRCKKRTARLLFELRALLDQVLAIKVTAGGDRGTKHRTYEENVLNAVIELITAEDERVDYGNSFFTESDSSEQE